MVNPKNFKLIKSSNPSNGCLGCYFNRGACHLPLDVGGIQEVREFDQEVGSCTLSGGIYILIAKDSGATAIEQDFLKSSYN